MSRAAMVKSNSKAWDELGVRADSDLESLDTYIPQEMPAVELLCIDCKDQIIFL